MITPLRVLWRLLSYRPLIPILLLLFYGVTLWVSLLTRGGKSALALAILPAFATGGLAALLTERVARYAFAAGTLGLPDHAHVTRGAQAWFLALFVGLPAAVVSALGAPPLGALCFMVVGAVAGIVLVLFGRLWLLVVPLAGHRLPDAQWMSSPVAQGVLLVLSCSVYWPWFALAEKSARGGGQYPALQASASRRRDGNARQAARLASADANAGDVSRVRGVASRLAHGLGYSLETSWRTCLYGVAFAAVLLAVWHQSRGADIEANACIMVIISCGSVVVGRLQAIHGAWIRTATEQALLRLTPGFPDAWRIKLAVLYSVLVVQRGGWLAWLGISAVALLLHLMALRYLVYSGLGLLTLSLACSAALLMTLARARVRRWHFSVVCLGLCVVAGATLLCLAGETMALRLRLLGALLMLAPPALALGRYLRTPLRLPVITDPSALRSDF